MAIQLSEQRTSLEREVGRLEDLLEADANWRALRALLSTGADGAATTAAGSRQDEHHQERLRLERALKSNRVYCARERLLEVIELMDAEAADGSDAAATGAPDLFDARPPAANAADPATALQPDITSALPPAPAQFSAKSAPVDRDAFRTRVKVKIRTTPPDTDPIPKSSLTSSLPDDLTVIRGIERKIAERLNALGVTRWEQIAAWRTSDVRSISAALGLDRQISRGNWIEQAALLSARAGRTISSPVKTAPAPAVAVEDVPAADRLEPALKPAGSAPEKEAASIEMAKAPAAQAANSADPVEPSEGMSSLLGVGGMIATAAASIAGRLGALSQPHPQGAAPDAAPDGAPDQIPDEIRDETSDETQGLTFGQGALRTSVNEETPSVSTEPQQNIDKAPPAPVAPAAPDALTLIRTLTPDHQSSLNDLGVSRFSQIADWNVDDVAHVSVVLGLGGRITRENWIEQAAILARGGTTHFARMQSLAPATSLAPPPPPPLTADPLMQARFAELSHSLATPVAPTQSATPVAAHEPPDTKRPENEPPDQAPAPISQAPADETPTAGATAPELPAVAATVFLSAGAAQALTAFASRQKLGSQLRREVLFEQRTVTESEPASEPGSRPDSQPTSPSDSPPENHAEPSAPEQIAATADLTSTARADVSEDDIATEIVLPSPAGAGTPAAAGDNAASAHTDIEPASGDEPSAALEDTEPVAIVDIPAQNSAPPGAAREAEVRIVPCGSPVPKVGSEPGAESAPAAPAIARSPVPRSPTRAQDDYDDDDFPAWNGQIEEASVEIIPAAVRGLTRPREHDEPTPVAADATITSDEDAGDRVGQDEDAAATKPVNRFLKALDGR